MISRTQRILGLDIGSNTVKGIELTKTGGRLAITGYAQSDISSAGTLRQAILDVLQEGRFKSKQVVSSVSGRSVIVRYISTPVMKTAELKASMQFEADKYIPFELSEVILDCLPLEEQANEQGEMRVVLVAVKRDIIDEHVRLLTDVGLYPHIVDVDCFALGNAFEMAPPLEPLDIPEPESDEAPAETDEPETPDEAGEDPQDLQTEAGVDEEQAEEIDEAPEEAPPAEEYLDEETSYEELPEEASSEELPEADATMMDTVMDYDQEQTEAQEDQETEDSGGIGDIGGTIPDLAEDAPQDGETSGEPQAANTSDGDVYALVDIGAQKTNINIIRNGISCFTREVYIGGEDMTEAVAKHLSLGTIEAETAKRQGDQEAAVLEAVGGTLDDLANEIFLSFDYFENQFDTEIETVYLSGGGSKLKGIGDVFATVLGRRVLSWDPVAGMSYSLAESQADKMRENAPQLAVAIGLASRLMGV